MDDPSINAVYPKESDMSTAAERLSRAAISKEDKREKHQDNEAGDDRRTQSQVAGAAKGIVVTAATALLSKKVVRRKVVRQLMRRKGIRKNMRRVVRSLIKQKLISKKDVRNFAGKKMAKKLAA